MASRQGIRRAVTRSVIATAGVLGMVAASGGVANAATSSQIVYHWSGSRPVAGEVWFNSGTHNPDKGRNSFTVKDRYCGDGWSIAATYQIGSGAWRWTNTVSCGEFSVSVAGDVSRQVIRWRGCKVSQNDPLIECEAQKTDYVD